MGLPLIEDRALRSGLTGDGFAVDAAADATEALRLFHVNPLRALVLDLGLPGPDGLTRGAWRKAAPYRSLS
jgi:DNA-binding response OmpR family regulator